MQEKLNSTWDIGTKKHFSKVHAYWSMFEILQENLKVKKISKFKKGKIGLQWDSHNFYMCVHAFFVYILLCVCAHALQICVHMEAKRQYQVLFKCHPLLCLRQSPTDLELVVQRTPGAHLSLAPWNYKHVPPHPAFLCGLWGSNSGPHACGINILFNKLS